MSAEPYVASEMELVQSHAFFAPARPQDMDVRAKAAEHGIAKIKADALREAAEAARSEAPGEPHAGATFVSHACWLDERANRIEEEA